MQKILVNSLWGKLAQKAGNCRVVYTHTPEAFHRLLDDPTLDIVDFTHVNEFMDRVVVRPKPEFARAPATNNLVIPTFVTSYARLHLFASLKQVDEKGGKRLYTDTYLSNDISSHITTILFIYIYRDSNIYAQKRGPVIVDDGECLGQWKRELPQRRITEFGAPCPKNRYEVHYNLQGEDKQVDVKCKGEQPVKNKILNLRT
jgi:hypothetical protein